MSGLQQNSGDSSLAGLCSQKNLLRWLSSCQRASRPRAVRRQPPQGRHAAPEHGRVVVEVALPGAQGGGRPRVALEWQQPPGPAVVPGVQLRHRLGQRLGPEGAAEVLVHVHAEHEARLAAQAAAQRCVQRAHARHGAYSLEGKL